MVINKDQVFDYTRKVDNDFTAFTNKVDEMENSYRWVKYPTKEAVYVPLDDNPIYIGVQRDEMPVSQDPRDTRRVKVSGDVSNDTLKEKMETTKTVLQFPEGGSMVAYPVGEFAIRGVYERVGLAAPVMTSTTTTSRRDEASPFNKGIAYDALRKYTKGNTLLRVGDEQVLGCLSDEYVIIPTPDVVNTVRNTLCDKYEFVEFVRGVICRETTSAEFAFEDYDLQRLLEGAFSKIGIDITTGFRPRVKVITSDIGVSGVNLFATVQEDSTGKIYPIGFPVKMEHKGSASLEVLARNTDSLFESFSGVEEMVDRLSEVRISNPADCVYNIGKKAQLPEKAIREGAEDFEVEYPYACSGAQVFGKLFEIFSSVAKSGKLSDLATMQAMENISRACLNGLKEFDKPVVKEGKVVGISPSTAA